RIRARQRIPCGEDHGTLTAETQKVFEPPVKIAVMGKDDESCLRGLETESGGGQRRGAVPSAVYRLGCAVLKRHTARPESVVLQQQGGKILETGGEGVRDTRHRIIVTGRELLSLLLQRRDPEIDAMLAAARWRVRHHLLGPDAFHVEVVRDDAATGLELVELG